MQSKSFNPQLVAGQTLAFELRANPVISHTVDGKSRRDDVVMHRKKQLLADRNLTRWSDWDDACPEKPSLYELVQDSCTLWLERRAEM